MKMNSTLSVSWDKAYQSLFYINTQAWAGEAANMARIALLHQLTAVAHQENRTQAEVCRKRLRVS